MIPSNKESRSPASDAEKLLKNSREKIEFLNLSSEYIQLAFQLIQPLLLKKTQSGNTSRNFELAIEVIKSIIPICDVPNQKNLCGYLLKGIAKNLMSQSVDSAEKCKTLTNLLLSMSYIQKELMDEGNELKNVFIPNHLNFLMLLQVYLLLVKKFLQV